MLQYDTKDIIKKAKQLADLVNSDFISYSEDFTLLNEAYNKVYEQSINAGDNLYIKSFEVDNVEATINEPAEFDLPDDFYQLFSVKFKSMGFFSTPLTRHVKDGYDTSPSYEIKNNKLVIYGLIRSNILIEYFPIPKTLFLAADDFPLKDYEGIPVAYYKGMLITHDKTNKKLNAIDLTTSEMVNSWVLANTEEEYTLNKVDAGANGIIAYFTKGENKYTLEANFDNEGTISPDEGKISVRADDGIFLEEAPEDNIISMLVDNENTFTITKDDAGKEFINGEVELATTGNKIDLLDGEMLYITSDDGMQTIFDYETEDLYFNGNRMEKYICTGDINYHSGYGSLVYKPGKGYFITSCFENTQLDYPNNIYYTLLSYMLAMSYKTKQDSDPSGLMVTYDETLNQYYDTFRRDANMPIRINNIYR